ncbi:hypothetical protein HOY82DRAFT_603184 [Tuber indicum]|nr:hypothetical protein HOY82DRAFT_603184 [Tuber indicum]
MAEPAGETSLSRRVMITRNDFAQGNIFPDNPRRLLLRTPATEKSHPGGFCIKTVEIRLSTEKEILIDLVEERTILGKPAPCRSGSAIAPRLVPFGEAVTDVFDGGRTQVRGHATADFVHSVGSNVEAFIGQRGKTVYSRLAHSSDAFHKLPSVGVLKKGDVETRAQIGAVLSQVSGKMMEDCGAISSDGRLIMKATSQPLYRGTYGDYENMLRGKIETPLQVHMASSSDVAALAPRNGSTSMTLATQLKQCYHSRVN